jgi:hypothetical protein
MKNRQDEEIGTHHHKRQRTTEKQETIESKSESTSVYMPKELIYEITKQLVRGEIKIYNIDMYKKIMSCGCDVFSDYPTYPHRFHRANSTTISSGEVCTSVLRRNGSFSYNACRNFFLYQKTNTPLPAEYKYQPTLMQYEVGLIDACEGKTIYEKPVITFTGNTIEIVYQGNAKFHLNNKKNICFRWQNFPDSLSSMKAVSKEWNALVNQTVSKYMDLIFFAIGDILVSWKCFTLFVILNSAQLSEEEYQKTKIMSKLIITIK